MIIKTKPRLSKLVASLTLLSFIGTNTVLAQPGAGISMAPTRETPAFLQIEIPSELASVEEVYEAPAQADPKLLIHIQNIHGNYEAQVQIKKILDYLHEKYGFKLLFAEGAVEKLNPDYLKFFPDKESNLKFADAMAKKGELTGLEYYLMDAPEEVEAVGIEKTELYRENYEAFKKVYAAKEETDRFLSIFEAKLDTLSSRLFPPNTRRLISEWKKFESGHRDFLPYVRRLSTDAKSVLGLDLESLFSQIEWPQITRLLALQSMEKDLDKSSAEKERLRLIGFLKTQNASPEIIRAIENLDEKKINMGRLDSADRKLEDLPRYLLERLVEEMAPKGFRFHDYPAFSLWAGHLILQTELDSHLLFEEIERVFDKILAQLTVNEKEKNLVELYRDGILLRKLMHLEVTRKEWDRVIYRKEWIALSALVSRMQKLSDDIQGKAPVMDEDWNTLSQNILNATGEAELLVDTLSVSYQFYDLARKRESVFWETIKSSMQERGSEKAVLVTGGFHTDGLMEIFREEKINFGVLMPRITGSLDNSAYIAGMLEKNQTMFDLATIEAIARLETRQAQVDQGRNELRDVAMIIETMHAMNGGPATVEKLQNLANSIATVTDVFGYKVQQNPGGRFSLAARREARVVVEAAAFGTGTTPGTISLEEDSRIIRLSLNSEKTRDLNPAQKQDLSKPNDRILSYDVILGGVDVGWAMVEVDESGNVRTGKVSLLSADAAGLLAAQNFLNDWMESIRGRSFTAAALNARAEARATIPKEFEDAIKNNKANPVEAIRAVIAAAKSKIRIQVKKDAKTGKSIFKPELKEGNVYFFQKPLVEKDAQSYAIAFLNVSQAGTEKEALVFRSLFDPTKKYEILLTEFLERVESPGKEKNGVVLLVPPASKDAEPEKVMPEATKPVDAEKKEAPTSASAVPEKTLVTEAQIQANRAEILSVLGDVQLTTPKLPKGADRKSVQRFHEQNLWDALKSDFNLNADKQLGLLNYIREIRKSQAPDDKKLAVRLITTDLKNGRTRYVYKFSAQAGTMTRGFELVVEADTETGKNRNAFFDRYDRLASNNKKAPVVNRDLAFQVIKSQGGFTKLFKDHFNLEINPDEHRILIQKSKKAGRSFYEYQVADLSGKPIKYRTKEGARWSLPHSLKVAFQSSDQELAAVSPDQKTFKIGKLFYLTELLPVEKTSSAAVKPTAPAAAAKPPASAPKRAAIPPALPAKVKDPVPGVVEIPPAAPKPAAGDQTFVADTGVSLATNDPSQLPVFGQILVGGEFIGYSDAGSGIVISSDVPPVDSTEVVAPPIIRAEARGLIEVTPEGIAVRGDHLSLYISPGGKISSAGVREEARILASFERSLLNNPSAEDLQGKLTASDFLEKVRNTFAESEPVLNALSRVLDSVKKANAGKNLPGVVTGFIPVPGAIGTDGAATPSVPYVLGLSGFQYYFLEESGAREDLLLERAGKLGPRWVTAATAGSLFVGPSNADLIFFVQATQEKKLGFFDKGRLKGTIFENASESNPFTMIAVIQLEGFNTMERDQVLDRAAAMLPIFPKFPEEVGLHVIFVDSTLPRGKLMPLNLEPYYQKLNLEGPARKRFAAFLAAPDRLSNRLVISGNELRMARHKTGQVSRDNHYLFHAASPAGLKAAVHPTSPDRTFGLEIASREEARNALDLAMNGLTASTFYAANLRDQLPDGLFTRTMNYLGINTGVLSQMAKLLDEAFAALRVMVSA